jgi:hypothetical protein
MSQMTTSAPSFAMAKAIDLPNPCAAPVINATLSLSFIPGVPFYRFNLLSHSS